MPDARRAHLYDEPDRVVRQLRVAPIADRGLDEGLVGVRRGRLELGAADDDPAVGLAGDVQQHVGILVLRAARAVALGVGVGRDVERVAQLGVPDVGRMCSEKVGSISLRTSCPSYSDHISPTVSSPTRVTMPPRSSSARSTAARLSRQSCFVSGRLAPTGQRSSALLVDVRHHFVRGRLVRQVVDAGARVDDRLEGGMRRHVMRPARRRSTPRVRHASSLGTRHRS